MFNVSTLYRQSIKMLHQIAVVGVDGPKKAISMHIQKQFKGMIVEILIAVILSKKSFFQPDSFMHMFNVSILYRQSIKMFHQKL